MRYQFLALFADGLFLIAIWIRWSAMTLSAAAIAAEALAVCPHETIRQISWFVACLLMLWIGNSQLNDEMRWIE